MSVLHLCFDGNFINRSIEIFEKYYPGENIFIVDKEKELLRMLRDDKHLLGIPLLKKNFPKIHQICIDKQVDKVVLHGLKREFIDCLGYLKQSKEYKVYWIFWGYELYFTLALLGKYKLVDGVLNPFRLKTYYLNNELSYGIKRLFLGKKVISRVLKDALGVVDYFCFWNYKDYELLQTNFHSNLGYKYFAYMAYERSENMVEVPEIVCKRDKTIMIHHQASNSGNHDTLMKRIAELDSQNEYTKIVPLSYGSSFVRKHVLKFGQKLFNSKFQPILKYMSRDEYFKHLSVEVALFGSRRQEASGNISTLLKNGVKIFLRRDNNLLQYYREKGYIIFSFEDDLHSLEDLKPLSEEEQRHNRECSLKNRVYYDLFMPTFFD
jgi:hypothetical protein